MPAVKNGISTPDASDDLSLTEGVESHKPSEERVKTVDGTLDTLVEFKSSRIY